CREAAGGGGWRPRARPPHPSTGSVHMSVSEGEVSGLVACDNEGCAGWTGAEPHAWETAHEQEYAVCRTGYRQEAHRRCAGRGASGWRGALLGKDCQRGDLG